MVIKNSCELIKREKRQWVQLPHDRIVLFSPWSLIAQDIWINFHILVCFTFIYMQVNQGAIYAYYCYYVVFNTYVYNVEEHL
jgi:hypothetical protein